MKIRSKLAVIAGTMALSVAPAVALAAPGGMAGKPAGSSHSSKAKAYGRYCQGESKKHVAGTHGTPYSTCVSGAKKLLAHTAA